MYFNDGADPWNIEENHIRVTNFTKLSCCIWKRNYTFALFNKRANLLLKFEYTYDETFGKDNPCHNKFTFITIKIIVKLLYKSSIL